MDRIEVMAMADEGLRIKAAELMGWAEITIEDGYLAAVCPAWSGQLPPGQTTKVDLPDYPNDIGAAWKLFEKDRIGVLFSLMSIIEDSDVQSLFLALSPDTITRAFILAMTEEAQNAKSNP